MRHLVPDFSLSGEAEMAPPPGVSSLHGVTVFNACSTHTRVEFSDSINLVTNQMAFADWGRGFLLFHPAEKTIYFPLPLFFSLNEGN